MKTAIGWLLVMSVVAAGAEAACPPIVPPPAAPYDADATTAIEDLQRRAEAGEAAAQYDYAVRLIQSRDVANGGDWLRRAAEGGDARAQAMLGHLHADGYPEAGIARDPAAALQWWTRAAEGEHFQAQIRIAIRHVDGDGVPKDPVIAAKWFERAARHGDANFHFALGDMYDKGEGVPKSADDAIRWYRRASEGGETAAFATLAGALLARGDAADVEEAVMWLYLADARATLDDERRATLRSLRANTERMFDDDVRRRIAERVAGWRPRCADA